MPAKKCRVKLSQDERECLKQLISKGKVSARKIIHANVLIHADESATDSLKDADIAKAIHISPLTVERVRKRFVEEGLESALNPKVQKRHRQKNWMGRQKHF
ncbi:MAG: helix-turn-helix domain-containing protein [Gammaproteobacteria bacterium]|nr:helix-turn-helix domain-containing protein [Gammaproteobacteria bacterium]